MPENLTEHPALQAFADRIVPADDFPSASAAGFGDFLRRLLAADRADAVPLLAAGLEGLDTEAAARHAGLAFAALDAAAQDELIDDLLHGRTAVPAGVEFAELLRTLVIQSYYGDPGAGGNRDAVSWRMIGYRETLPGTVWPERSDSGLPTIGLPDAAARYDAVVVGAGAGGGVTACVLAENGFRVLLVERGPALDLDERPDHLRNQRSIYGYETPAGPPVHGNPRLVTAADGRSIAVPPSDARWNNNAMVLGGGTRVFGAQAWRFSPEDFRMASTYGVPEGSSLADWPISYADLEPYYDRAEWEWGVSGSVGGNSADGPRRRDYPMPPLPSTVSGDVLAAGAAKLGWTVGPVPLLVNSAHYNGRPACANCGTCVGFSCQVDAKNGSHNTVIPRALATGNCDLLVQTRVERVVTDATGTVTGVALNGPDGRREIEAGQVVLCAGAVETARLLLISRSDREPYGLGNNRDQVGRNLQGHVYNGALGLFDDVVQECVGPGPTISTNDFRHHNGDLIGGGMLANEFVPTPLNNYAILTGLGLVPTWGAAGKQGIRELYSRTSVVMGPIQEIPNPRSRVTVEDSVTDSLGLPAARLTGDILEPDVAAAAFLSERAVEWLHASGARKVVPLSRPGRGGGPSGGQHQAGTCRMGDDPATSVTDPHGRVWGHDNLRIADGSVHVTNGGVNPVLTILANAYRISELLARG
jgi:choline dehydrogenase-like flavoprotein